MLSPRPLFAVGLALGGAATWLALSPGASDPAGGGGSGDSASATSLARGPVVVPAWAWRDSATPPPLAPDIAGAAIVAWADLRSPDGSPADYATRVSHLRALLVRLPADAFPRLLDTLSRTDTEDDRTLRRLAFDAWTTQDAPAAARWAVGHWKKSRELAHGAVSIWASQDALAAATWACALPDDEVARRLAPIALAALAEKDSARALALAGSRDPAFREAVLQAILAPLAKADPAGTVRAYAPELWKNGRGFWAMRETIEAWMKKDAPAALAWLVAQPRGNNHELSNWFQNLGGDSPEMRRTLADAIVSASGMNNRAAAMQGILFSWGANQPDEAIAWLNGLQDQDLRVTLLERAANSYYTYEPQKSLPLALIMPEGEKRSERLSQLLGAWAKVDSAAALEWLAANGDQPGVAAAGTAVQGALLADIARSEPQTAIAEWQTITDPKTKLATLDALATAWGQTDPAAALKWAFDQQATLGQRSSGAYSGLISQWARTEPEAALRWVEDWSASQPENQRHYTSYYLQALAGTWSDKAPREQTANLYTKIKDDKLRAETLRNHVGEWLTKDPAGARVWLESSKALPADEVARLLAAQR